MAWTFNPFSGTFDQKGSGGGGGASYIDGEVQNFSALPETVGTPPVDSAYLCREPEGTWLLNRRPAGIYIRTANTGTRASDWTHAGAFPDVFNDDNFVLYDNADSTKNLAFDVGTNVPTSTTVTLTAPSSSGTIALTSDLTGGVSAVGASAADVFSVSGSDLVADSSAQIDSADPFVQYDTANSKLVYANPLSRPSGALYVGLAPTTTALGTDAVNIQSARSADSYVAAHSNAVAIGKDARSTNGSSVAVGSGASAGNLSVAIGASASTFSNPSGSVAIGRGASAGGVSYVVAIGGFANGSAQDTIAVGGSAAASAANATALGRQVSATLRAQFATRPFNAVYWSGTTTDATPTSLNLDGIATNKFSISANRAYFVDISLIARRSDTQDKWLVARRFLGIRRDGSNNTSLIGSVQTIGTDQSDGSPTWTFSLTADTANSNLELEVTGAASETVEWTATAFFRAT